jgi:hypothetical protein
MPAQYTVYRENGDVETSTSLPFHFVGEKADLAVEVQVGSNASLEIPLKEIFERLLER